MSWRPIGGGLVAALAEPAGACAGVGWAPEPGEPGAIGGGVHRTRALSWDPALRWPKRAAADRPTEPPMHKPLMGVAQEPGRAGVRVTAHGDETRRRQRRTTCPSPRSSTGTRKAGGHNGSPVQPARMPGRVRALRVLEPGPPRQA